MNIYISADIEGIGCVVRGEHSNVQGREYARAREFMTREVNAAIAGAFAQGAEKVVVADSHNVGVNLIPELLDDRAELIMGGPRPLGMMEGIDQGFDAAMFIGYHAMAGTPDSPIVHIDHGRIYSVEINGTLLGEMGMNMALAGHFNTPVVFVSSDAAGCREALTHMPEVETVAVKKGIGAYAGQCLHPATCRQRIQAGVSRALSRNFCAPLTISTPVSMRVSLTTTSGADRIARMPGASRLNGRTILWEGNSILDAYRAFLVMSDLMDLVHFI
jgi:D-amino peptidase